jgi:hypothetical protein
VSDAGCANRQFERLLMSEEDAFYSWSPILDRTKLRERGTGLTRGISPVEVRFVNRPEVEAPETRGYRQTTFVSDCRAGEVVYWTNADHVAVTSNVRSVTRADFAGVAVKYQEVGEVGLIQVRGRTTLPAAPLSNLSEVGTWPPEPPWVSTAPSTPSGQDSASTQGSTSGRPKPR